MSRYVARLPVRADVSDSGAVYLAVLDIADEWSAQLKLTSLSFELFINIIYDSNMGNDGQGWLDLLRVHVVTDCLIFFLTPLDMICSLIGISEVVALQFVLTYPATLW